MLKKYKKIISIMAIVSLLANGFVQFANAASMVSVSDKLSDSDISQANVTHTVTFTNQVPLSVGQYFDITLPQGAGNFGAFAVGNITCPANTSASYPSGGVARCTATSGVASGTVKTITITGVTNPNVAGSFSITVSSHQAGGTTIEQSTAMVAIIDNVDVSARVASTLTFEIRPLATTTGINGATTTIAAATTSMSFGTLTVGTSSIIGQELRVTTNADDGYSVTVEQDGNLISPSGSDIDSFVDGTAGAPQAWVGPTPVLDSEATYGHMGFTTDDDSVTGGNLFGGGKWRGFSGVTPVEVLYHNGPADGSTQSKGLAKVAFRIQISALQEAGDYTNTLTYIATPTY